MPLDARQSFKAGFLLRCAQEGLTHEETRQRVKEAAEKLASDWLPSVGGALQTAIGVPVALGAGLGAVGGYGLAKMREEDIDPEEAKTQELIAALKFYTENARRSTKRMGLRQPQRAPASPSLRF